MNTRIDPHMERALQSLASELRKLGEASKLSPKFSGDCEQCHTFSTNLKKTQTGVVGTPMETLLVCRNCRGWD